MEVKRANRVELGLSNYPAYSIAELNSKEDFLFTTIHGITYTVYFTEADGYAPSASFANSLRMFGFGPKKGTYNKGKLPKDPQISITIFEVLYYYLSKNPDRILLYYCSEESIWQPGSKNIRYAKWRSQVFGKWFSEWQQTGVMPAEKIDCYLYNNVVYGSCIFRSGNSYESEIRQTIEEIIIEKY